MIIAVSDDSGNESASATASPPLSPPHISIRVVLGVILDLLLIKYIGMAIVTTRLNNARIMLLVMIMSVIDENGMRNASNPMSK